MKTFISITIAILALSLFTFFTAKKNKSKAFDVGGALDYCVLKAQNTASSLTTPDSLPRNIYAQQTNWNKVGVHDWTSGFWPGVLWLSYEASGDSSLLTYAKNFTKSLEDVLSVPVDNHDLGFMLYCSYGNGYRLTENPAYHDLLIKAADSLVTLYNPKVGTILSWPAMREKMNWPHNTIIDNMINLELLFWASKHSRNQAYYDIAVKHAETTMENFIRPDFTTLHVGVFDTIDGHFIKGATHQGYADDSMWARGQAWGIYGYAMCFRETGKKKFLKTAQKLADVFINKLPEDGIPYWDFDDPAIPDAPKDASAAAVAASAMLELSEFAKDEAGQEKYRHAAENLLATLSTPDYLSEDQNQAFLLHSTGHKPHKSEVDASIIYADYYYLEALLRLEKMEMNDK